MSRTKDEKEVENIGPGGYKCRCCGPAPKDRPKWRRMVRRRLKQMDRKNAHQEAR